MPVDPSVSDSPIILWALLVTGVLAIVFGAVTRGTTGFGAWLNSLRRISSDAKAADIVSRDTQIANLTQDLKTEREARRADRKHFDEEMRRRDRELSHRDELARAHVQWDWKVYNVLVLAGLLDANSEDAKPPRLI